MISTPGAMITFLARRFLQLVPVLFGVSVAVFLMIHLIPGDPAVLIAGLDATEADIESAVWQQLRTCYDPEIPINIVELGLVYECTIERAESGQRVVKVRMTLTAPGCGMGEILTQDVREKIEMIPTVERADVELVFDPPWNQSMMSEEARLEAGLL